MTDGARRASLVVQISESHYAYPAYLCCLLALLTRSKTCFSCRVDPLEKREPVNRQPLTELSGGGRWTADGGSSVIVARSSSLASDDIEVPFCLPYLLILLTLLTLFYLLYLLYLLTRLETAFQTK